MEQHAIKRYTVEEFLALPDDGIRRELIDGIIYIKVERIDDRPLGMAGASPAHQSVLVGISTQLKNFLDGKRCKVYVSPVDVQLHPNFTDGTLVQPDIFVICDKSKFDNRVYKGVPELVIEILSPTTARIDRTVKFRKYRQAGVKEYWIVDPIDRFVQVYLLFDGNYMANAYYDDNNDVPVVVLEGCSINLAKVFAELDEE